MKKILSLMLMCLMAISSHGQSTAYLNREITPDSLVKISAGEGNNPNYLRPILIDDLAIQVSKDENREYSFTNKRSAYWYGRTHQDHFGAFFAEGTFPPVVFSQTIRCRLTASFCSEPKQTTLRSLPMASPDSGRKPGNRCD